MGGMMAWRTARCAATAARRSARRRCRRMRRRRRCWAPAGPSRRPGRRWYRSPLPAAPLGTNRRTASQRFPGLRFLGLSGPGCVRARPVGVRICRAVLSPTGPCLASCPDDLRLFAYPPTCAHAINARLGGLPKLCAGLGPPTSQVGVRAGRQCRRARYAHWRQPQRNAKRLLPAAVPSPARSRRVAGAARASRRHHRRRRRRLRLPSPSVAQPRPAAQRQRRPRRLAAAVDRRPGRPDGWQAAGADSRRERRQRAAAAVTGGGLL